MYNSNARDDQNLNIFNYFSFPFITSAFILTTVSLACLCWPDKVHNWQAICWNMWLNPWMQSRILFETLNWNFFEELELQIQTQNTAQCMGHCLPYGPYRSSCWIRHTIITPCGARILFNKISCSCSCLMIQNKRAPVSNITWALNQQLILNTQEHLPNSDMVEKCCFTKHFRRN